MGKRRVPERGDAQLDLELPHGVSPLLELERRAARSGGGVDGVGSRRCPDGEGDGKFLWRVDGGAGELLDKVSEGGGVGLDEGGGGGWWSGWRRDCVVKAPCIHVQREGVL